MSRKKSGVDTKHAEIGRRLQEAREQTDLSQVELARILSVTTQTVNQAESGKNKPSWEHLIELSRLSGRDLQWIMTGKDSAGGGAIKAGDGGYDVPIINPADVRDFRAASAKSTRMHRATFPSNDGSFAIVVNDKSNEPQLIVGDTCVFDPMARPEPGKFVLALIGKAREPVIRMLQEREEGFVLVPANPAWGPKILKTKADGEIIAVLVEFTRKA